MTPRNSRSGRVARSSHQSQSARAVRVAQAAQAAQDKPADPEESARQAAAATAANANRQPAPQGAYTPVYTPGSQKSNAANNAYERQSAAAQYSRNNPSYSHRKTSKARKVLMGLLIAVLIVGAGGGAAFALTNAYLNSINTQLNQGTKTEAELLAIEKEVTPLITGFEEPFYLLLIGSDRREDDESMGQRSDTNIVVRVDAQNNQLTMVSIPRDTKIELDGVGTAKFNAAYNTDDGAAAVIREAKQLLGVDISYYAEVNFEELVGLVDAVGGVDVYVDELIDDPDADGTSANPDWDRIILDVGEHHLNGDQALCFARSRAFADGDFTRTSNQRKLIQAIVDKVLALPLTQLPGVVESAAACVHTNLTVQDIITLAQLFSDGEMTVYSAMVPSYTQMIGDVSYVINDEDKTAEMMKLVREGKDPSDVVSELTAPDIDGEVNSAAFEEYDASAYSYYYDNSAYGAAAANTYSAPTYDNGTSYGAQNYDSGYNSGQTYDQGYVEPTYQEPAYDYGYDAGAGTDTGTGTGTDYSADAGYGTDTALPDAA